MMEIDGPQPPLSILMQSQESQASLMPHLIAQV